MRTGEYNTFNEGGFVTKSVSIIIFCTLSSVLSVVLTGAHLFYANSKSTRLGLVVSSLIMFIVAVIFVIGRVPIMWIDNVAMAYALKVT